MSTSCCTGKSHGHLIIKISQNIGHLLILCLLIQIKEKMITRLCFIVIVHG